MPREIDDPNVNLPRAVREKIALSDKFISDMTGQKHLDGEAVANDPEPDDQPQVQEPEEEQNEAQPEVREPNQPDPLAAMRAQYDALEAQHRTLQGKYNSEIRTLNGAIERMNNELNALRTQPKVEQPTPLTKPNGHGRITPDDINTYGEDLIGVIGRRAQEIAEEIVAERVSAETKALKDQLAVLTKDVRSSDQIQYESWMRANVANFDQQDRDDGFFAWLEGVDPFSGLQRKAILGGAINSKDYQRCKMVFEGYQRETAAIAQPVSRETAVRSGQAAERVLETLAAPRRARATTSGPTPQEVPEEFTSAQLEAFYREANKPRSRYSEAEIAAIEKRIQSALLAGRIKQQPRF